MARHEHYWYESGLPWLQSTVNVKVYARSWTMWERLQNTFVFFG